MKPKKGGLKQSSSENKATNELPIVGIGASAGGLDPIRKLLNLLPVDMGMAFVVIQHLAPGQESMLPEILSRSTKMNVLQVKDGMKVEKNHVYVITPGTTMTLKNGYLRLAPKAGALKPINDFMVSLASELKAQAIGIVLSGTGNDGTEGLKAIKVEGGITFAQDPDTAQYADMPRNAIATATPDFVLSPEMIAKELGRIAKHPQLIRFETKDPEKEKVEPELKKIMILLKTSFGVDFTHYRETTINRRITRRMVINKTENMKAYVEHLRKHPVELQILFDDLLIGVTSFFREPDTFLALSEKVFPVLVDNRFPSESVRIWVPGCSTGEEVYSIAIAIQEFLEEKAQPNVRIQIFGTDANERNVEKARQGIYTKNVEDSVSENRLKRFFTSYNGHYQITKRIRDMCIFARQDITTDPPFSNIDLVMCRNVLIYFDEYLHEKVLPIFHYGLKPNGFLVLSESESVGKFQYLFEPISPKGLIYRKKQALSKTMFGANVFVPYAAKEDAKSMGKTDLLTVLGEKVDHLITAEYGPATLLVSNNLDILVFRGDVALYLSPESGAASLNVNKIIRKELRSQVQTALFRAKKEKKAFKEKVHFKQKEQQKTVYIEIRPLETAEYNEPFYLVLFTEAPSNELNWNSTKEVEPVLPGEMESLKDRQIRELREDLEATKQSLQTLVEGQEAINEELRSSMEEVQSSNEELMSTNEGLETAKEELQSGNEELQTLNEELKNRNQVLSRLNDDLTNLQTNIDIPVVIVDRDLKIRRFTLSAQDFLKISPSNIGQSIGSVNLGANTVDFEKTIMDVITKLTFVNREVTCGGNRLCEVWVRPYLTEEKKVDGAVLSFTDISERKKSETERELVFEFLRIANGTTNTRDLIKGTADFFQKKSGCEAVGVRLKEGEDYPYYETRGFPPEHVQLENRLCARDEAGCVIRDFKGNPIIECMCGNVICGRFDPSKEFFTEKGSFWTNSTTRLLATTTDADRQIRTRNRCNGEGYESVALLPLQVGNTRLGLLQLNDKRENMFTLEIIQMWERIADRLALSLSRTIAEAELHNSEQRYHTLFSNMEEGFFLGEPILDGKGNPFDYRVLEANSAFEKQTGLKLVDLIGKTIKDALPGVEESWVQTYCRVALTGEPVHFENYNNNTQRYYEVYSFSPTKGRFASLFMDVTERVRIQNKLKEYSENLEKLVEERTRQLRDSERLAAIGTTAAMVGHDIRNPLQSIIGELYLAKSEAASISQTEVKNQLIESVENIEKDIGYINKIVQDLQDFAKPIKANFRETDLKEVIDDMMKKIEVPKNIVISIRVEEDTKSVMADPDLLKRVLGNLFTNAVHAMPRGGKLSIRSQKEAMDTVIRVQDSGVGIPEEVKGRLFTPLFTTKSKGQGFGLAVVKRMIEAMGGTVTFESQEGKGTTFTLHLPPQKK